MSILCTMNITRAIKRNSVDTRGNDKWKGTIGWNVIEEAVSQVSALRGLQWNRDLKILCHPV